MDIQLKKAKRAPTSWWDGRMTELLLSALPPTLETLVHYGCGRGEAAEALLPRLPQTHYIGVAQHAEQLEQAQHRFAASPLLPRVSLRLGQPDELPVPDGIANGVLSVMALQHCADLRALLHEVERSLAPGGVLVAVEPDNLGQRLYFDGTLEEMSAALHRLCMKARVALQPADIALGPRLPNLLKRAGFAEIRLQHHTVGGGRLETARAFCERVEKICERVVHLAELPTDLPELDSCREAIRRFMFAGLPKRLGFSGHLVPVFLTRALLAPS